MPSFTKVVLAGLASLFVMTGGVRADDCTDGPVDQLRAFGKARDGHNNYCQTSWKTGLVVSGIEVWANKHHIKAIQFTYSDGSKPPVQGTVDKDADRQNSINWDPKEPIQVMKIAKNKKDDGLGLVYVEVGGKKLDVRSDKIKGEEEVNEASGLLLGASGISGGFMHQWTPLFMGRTQGQAKITNLRFDDNLEEVNQRQQGIKQISLHEVWIKNTNPFGTNGSDQSWEFEGSKELAKTTSLSSSSSSTFGVSTSVEIGGGVSIPFLAEAQVTVGFGASYEFQAASSRSTEESTTDTVRWNQGSTETSDLIKPGFAKHCKASAYQGTYQGDYTSTVEITVGGKKFTYEQRGEAVTVSNTGAFTECKDVLIADIPAGANNIVKATQTTESKRAVEFVS